MADETAGPRLALANTEQTDGAENVFDEGETANASPKAVTLALTDAAASSEGPHIIDLDDLFGACDRQNGLDLDPQANAKPSDVETSGKHLPPEYWIAMFENT